MTIGNNLTATGTITGSGTLTTTGTVVMGSSFLRNRIINGDMRIDQRNAGASVTPNGSYLVDRWTFQNSQASKFTAQQNAGSVTPPTGYTNYLGFVSSSAYTPLSTDYFSVIQYVEGFNAADFGWGAAGASTVTLSFWVRSSLTGTFGGSVFNSAGNRGYVFSYTINSANTWEQKTVTIVGDTTGTWLTNNGIGVAIRFGLGAGSTQQGTAGSWSGSAVTTVTGAVNVCATNAATWYVTGVQLEVGSVATPFERRQYGQELALCQRYYWRQVAGNNGYPRFSSGICLSATSGQAFITFPVTMRTYPSAVDSNALAFYDGITVSSATVTIDSVSNSTAELVATTSSMTTGRPGFLIGNNSASAYIGFTAEL